MTLSTESVQIHVRVGLTIDPVGLRILFQESSARLDVLGIPPI